MKNISHWAKNNTTAARTMVAVFSALLFAAAIYVGELLDQINVHLHYSVLITAAVSLAASVTLYPLLTGKKKSFGGSYYKRKGCELTFLLATLICICFVFNKNNRVVYFNTYPTLSGSFLKSKEKVKETAASSDNNYKKNLKKQFKELRKELKKSKASGTKIALITLVLIGGIGLSLFLAALSCNISCNGSPALSAFVLIGGLTAIVFLMVLAIKKINRSDG